MLELTLKKYYYTDLVSQASPLHESNGNRIVLEAGWAKHVKEQIMVPSSINSTFSLKDSMYVVPTRVLKGVSQQSEPRWIEAA